MLTAKLDELNTRVTKVIEYKGLVEEESTRLKLMIQRIEMEN